MTLSDSDELMTPHEVANLLRVKVNTIYGAAAEGRIPAVRLWRGRRKSLIRFRRADIEALIAGAPAHLATGKAVHSRPTR